MIIALAKAVYYISVLYKVKRCKFYNDLNFCHIIKPVLTILDDTLTLNESTLFQNLMHKLLLSYIISKSSVNTYKRVVVFAKLSNNKVFIASVMLLFHNNET